MLVVDDDPVFTLLASETLEQAGYAAPIADSQRSALSLLTAVTPDLVLLDVQLPDASGFDLCAKIRASPAGLDVPIMMVTGNNDTASIARAFEAGATDFINKPVLWPTLPQRVGFILRACDNVRALKASEHKVRALLQALPDSIFMLDGRGMILDHITGRGPGEGGAVGMGLDRIMPAEVAMALRRTMDTMSPVDMPTLEFEIAGGDERRTFEARLRRQADGTFLLILRDATERRLAEARIEYLAYYDPLTGLPNRQLFVRDVSSAIADENRCGIIAVLYLDLDRFRRVNDHLGHSVGDALLKGVARRLEHSLRSSDLISPGRLARLGGDEFVILLTGVADQTQVTSVATRIEQVLGEPFEVEGHRFVITPSIGIALHPRDGSDIEDLLVKADMAMYQAKDQGRNGHAFYGDSIAVRSLGRLELESDLRRAFDAGDFQLHYQPKMNIESGAVVGVEALLRWHHRDRGWIPPDKFIPIAEETGLIVALGDWVVRETCRQIKEWTDDGIDPVSIAVNVSVGQFGRDDFVDCVLRAMWQYGIKPDQLELEITESLLMRNVSGTMAALRRLGAAGISLSIDDFGTGYSSLGYLRQFPVDALKIDRSFVKDLPASSDAAAICAAIIAMARELKLRVIAEGVETSEQLEFLRAHRCDEVQGYLISKPLSAVDFAKRFRAGADTDRASPTMLAKEKQS